MSTRSRIGVMHGDVVKSIYCHWDGYLEHNGQILLDHYDSARANNLVALGDMSTLRPEIGDQHPFSQHEVDEMDREDFIRTTQNMCTFYGRDRLETGVDFKAAHTFAEFLEQCDNCAAEYYYIMRDGMWYVGTTYDNMHPMSKTLTELAVAIENEKEPA